MQIGPIVRIGIFLPSSALIFAFTNTFCPIISPSFSITKSSSLTKSGCSLNRVIRWCSIHPGRYTFQKASRIKFSIVVKIVRECTCKDNPQCNTSISSFIEIESMALLKKYCCLFLFILKIRNYSKIHRTSKNILKKLKNFQKKHLTYSAL